VRYRGDNPREDVGVGVGVGVRVGVGVVECHLNATAVSPASALRAELFGRCVLAKSPSSEMDAEYDGRDAAAAAAINPDVTKDFTGRCPPPATSTCGQNATVEWSSVVADTETRVALLSEAYRSVLTGIGEDPDREGLLKTPERAAKAMMYFTKGYEENAAGNVHDRVLYTETWP